MDLAYIKDLLEILKPINVMSLIGIIYLGYLIRVITRFILFIVFANVYKKPFQKAIDASIRLTSFGKDK